MDRPPADRSEPDAQSVVVRSGPGFAERVKELDFEQRARLRGGGRAVLSLGLLRALWRRLWTPTLPATAARVPHPAPGTLAVTFVGHATVMITTPRARILTDPMLGNWIGGLRRVRAPAIDPDDLDDVGLVLISHAHRDHLSRGSLAHLPRTATLVVPRACRALVARLGFARVVELPPGSPSFTFEDVEIAAVPARHDGARGLLGGRGRGTNGYVLSAWGLCVYFAGDTGYFDGFRDIGQAFAPDLALLPIAGYQPTPLRRGHLSPLDAIYAFEDLGARTLVPIGYGSFELGYEPIDEPLAWLRAVARERGLGGALAVLEHGQSCVIGGVSDPAT